MSNENIYKRLEEIGAQITGEMKAIVQRGYLGRPAVASGNLLRSIDYDVYVDNGVWTLAIEYADYGKWVDQGRNPGKFPPKKDIERWVKLKGLPYSAVWPIMMKIKKAGFYSSRMGKATSKSTGQTMALYTRPKGLHFTDPLAKNLDLQKIMKDFEGLVYGAFKDDIDKMIKNEISK